MIYSLTGKITATGENTIIVDTGAVAFELICSGFAVSELSGKEQTVLTYLQVKEDGMTLFGFLNNREKLLFLDLITVSGVGPKLAISVLSGLSTEKTLSAILNSDAKTLSQIKGLGKKTAERIVLELSTKLGAADALQNLVAEKSLPEMHAKEIEEAAEVLVSTGINKGKATEIAKSNYESGMTAEELVVRCFKNLK